MKEDQIESIVAEELKIRIKLLQQALVNYGYTAEIEKDQINITHLDGFSTTAYFSKAKMRETVGKGGFEALDKARHKELTPEQSKELQLKGGKDALEQNRISYVQGYYQKIERDTYTHMNPTKVKDRKKDLQNSVRKSESTAPEI